MSQNSLTIVGTGIKLGAQLTVEAKANIEQAEKLFFSVADHLTAAWLQQLNDTAESIDLYYDEGKPRLQTYMEMTRHVVAAMEQYSQICVVFYGHPGLMVTPSEHILRQANAAGWDAKMLPAISALDCLCADLGIDLIHNGLLQYDATDFLLRARPIVPQANLILWQIGVAGRITIDHDEQAAQKGRNLVAQRLLDVYGANHEVVIYEAAIVPTFPARIERIPLSELATATLSAITTLFVPPAQTAPWNNQAMAELGINGADLVLSL